MRKAIARTKRMPKKLVGRKVTCSHCAQHTVLGKIGIFNKVMFIFCTSCCEKDLPGCLKQMRDVAAIDKGVARAS